MMIAFISNYLNPMKHLLHLFLPILFFSCSTGDEQNKKTEYQINKSIVAEVAKNTHKEGKMDVGSLEIRYYENDSLVLETFSSDKSIPFLTIQEHSQSTIDINGMVGLFDAWGFQLHVTKEKFEVTYFSGADFGIYKKQKSDTTLTPGIALKCKNTSLTLASYPDFEEDEEIIGIVGFKTPDYWEVKNGVEKKIHVEGKAYFATKLTDKQ